MFLDPGQQVGDRHRIELGQRAEQFGVGVEGGDALFRQAEHVGQQGAQGRFDRRLIVPRHWLAFPCCIAA